MLFRDNWILTLISLLNIALKSTAQTLNIPFPFCPQQANQTICWNYKYKELPSQARWILTLYYPRYFAGFLEFITVAKSNITHCTLKAKHLDSDLCIPV